MFVPPGDIDSLCERILEAHAIPKGSCAWIEARSRGGGAIRLERRARTPSRRRIRRRGIAPGGSCGTIICRRKWLLLDPQPTPSAAHEDCPRSPHDAVTRISAGQMASPRATYGRPGSGSGLVRVLASRELKSTYEMNARRVRLVDPRAALAHARLRRPRQLHPQGGRAGLPALRPDGAPSVQVDDLVAHRRHGGRAEQHQPHPGPVLPTGAAPDRRGRHIDGALRRRAADRAGLHGGVRDRRLVATCLSCRSSSRLSSSSASDSAYPLAVWGLNYRNLPGLIGNLFRLWLYLSPALWALETRGADPMHRNLMRLNPLTGLFEAYHGAIGVLPVPGSDTIDQERPARLGARVRRRLRSRRAAPRRLVLHPPRGPVRESALSDLRDPGARPRHPVPAPPSAGADRALRPRPIPQARREAGGVLGARATCTFDVPSASVFGIIGQNGSGKSTMLRVLSRILAPDEGEVELRGQVSSLLSLGAGFHAELTGLENITYNGILLGLSRQEIERRKDKIIEFSGLGARIDTPVTDLLDRDAGSPRDSASPSTSIPRSSWSTRSSSSETRASASDARTRCASCSPPGRPW